MSSVSRIALDPVRTAALVQRRHAPRPGSVPTRREGFPGVTASLPFRVHRELDAQHAALIG